MTAETALVAPFGQASPKHRQVHRRGRRLLVFVAQQQ